MNDLDTIIEFQIDKKIDELDLESLILYLESKRSGGGDIVEHKLDETKQKLTVKFLEKEIKENLLKKNDLAFRGFRLTPISKDKCAKNEKILLFGNFKDGIDKLAIELYAEHIVRNNSVVAILPSIIFQNEYYITFESKIDFNSVQMLHKRTPKLLGSLITISQTFQTNSVIGKFINNEEYLEEEVLSNLELHFTNKNRSGIDSYAEMKVLNKFLYLICLNDSKSVENVMKKEHVILRKKFILEECLCIDKF
jgi:hypothetical protein